LLDEAKRKGADLIIYPELALTTFFPRWYMEDQAEVDTWFEKTMPNEAVQPLFDRAAQHGIAMYLDEGSRYVTLRNNAIGNVGVWLNLNSQNNLAPRRTAMDNLAIGNWHDSGRRTGAWTPYLNNREVDTVLVAKGAWPDAAKAVIAHAGIEPEKP
ncbi:nitrilase-related carbon-nitrogen hydrolase, partial [Pseudomonas sp. EA_65y_Pfl1_P113]|uniref:nitrilase-related carbon-nitrogen hydrolase n=1 Tax=Pseudomonas sp. EA_65y_Pfl1_P113 TaxID=3088692 RepID=UPI0030DCC21A